MAGHSQFKNIMHRKGRQDSVRSKMFSKLAREITVAAKAGLPDPTMNAALRLAIQNAKAQSMRRTTSTVRSRRHRVAKAKTTSRSATKATAPAALQ